MSMPIESSLPGKGSPILLHHILEPNTEEILPAYRFAQEAFAYLDQVTSRDNIVDRYLLNPSLSYDDGVYLAYIFAVFIIMRGLLCGAVGYGLDKHPSLFKMIAERCGVTSLDRRQKFAENLWFGLWHTISTFWSSYLLLESVGTELQPGWLRLHISQPDGRWYWMASVPEVQMGSVGWPILFVTGSIRLYYLTALGFFLSCVCFLQFESRKSDFIVMVLHHVAASYLVGVSYILSYWKIGLVVVFLHDLSDVFLYLGKALNIIGARLFIKDTFLSLFVLTFVVGRLIIYPVLCVYPSLNFQVMRSISYSFVKSHYEVPGGFTLPGFQVLLLMVNCYWIICIYNSVKNQIKKRMGAKTIKPL